MNKKIAGLALLAVSSVVSAEGGYWGANISQLDINEDVFNLDYGPKIVSAKLGADVNPYFAVEGRIGLSLSDDSASTATVSSGVFVNVTTTFEVENTVSLLAIGKIPLGEASNLYGMAGFTRVKGSLDATATATNGINTATASVSGSDSDNSSTFGIGFNVGVTDAGKINVELAKLYDKDDLDISALSIGWQQGF